MKYNFPEKYEQIQNTTFNCIHELIGDAIETVMESEEEYASVTIVASCELAEDLIKTLSSTEVNGFNLTYGIIEFNNIEYDGLYYVSINKDGTLWCEPAWHKDNEWHKAGYLYTEGTLIYIAEDDINDEIIETLGENNILIFDFAEDSECETY